MPCLQLACGIEYFNLNRCTVILSSRFITRCEQYSAPLLENMVSPFVLDYRTFDHNVRHKKDCVLEAFDDGQTSGA